MREDPRREPGKDYWKGRLNSLLWKKEKNDGTGRIRLPSVK